MAPDRQVVERRRNRGPRRSVRRFKDVEAVAGIDLRVAPGRDLRLPGPERRRQVDHRAHAHHAPPALGRPATVAGFDVAQAGAEVRAAIGAALQEAALDPFLTGREHLRLRPRCTGSAAPSGKRLIERLLDRVGLTQRRRPQGAHLLRRHEAPARPRARADPRPRRSSSSTSRRPGSTRRAAPRSGTRSGASRATRA